MAYTVPGTVAAGDVATAAAWNVVVGDIVDHESRIRQAAVMAVYKTGDTYTQGSGNPIPFTATDVYDTDTFHDTATNTSRITIPTGLGGTYLFEVSLWTYYTTQPTYADIIIRANGTIESSKAIRGGTYSWPAGSNAHVFKASGIAYNCVATDYFDVTLAITGGTYPSALFVGNSTSATPSYFRAVRLSS